MSSVEELNKKCAPTKTFENGSCITLDGLKEI